MTSLIRRLRVHHVLGTSLALGVAAGCANGALSDAPGAVVVPDGGPQTITHMTPGDSGEPDSGTGSPSTLNELCGTTNYCRGRTPDDTGACLDYDGGYPTEITGRDGGRGPKREAGISDGGTSDGSAADAEPHRGDGGKSPSDAGGLSDHQLADGGVEYQALPIPPPPLPEAGGPRYACQIGRDDLGGPVHKCVIAGIGQKGDPCSAVKDCGPGLGCVGAAPVAAGQSSATGLCLPYCCEGSQSCDGDPGTYCTERPLLDGTKKTPLNVPVCAPGVSCGLLEPFPCNGAGCACPKDLTCTVVRADDGTTGCVTPGTHTVGETCPCAPGYYCSLATSTCVKICKTDGIDARCVPGKCQATAGFPPGFGLCVGSPPSVQ
jgi:hypothetical protein